MEQYFSTVKIQLLQDIAVGTAKYFSFLGIFPIEIERSLKFLCAGILSVF